MFALPTPYFAERQIYTSQPDGSCKPTWETCKVIGIVKDDDGEPAYVVEIYHHGTSSLAIEQEVKRLERGHG